MGKGIGTPTLSGEIPEGHDAESIKLCNKHCKHDEPELQELPEIPEQPADPKASDYLAGNIRQEDELYCDFKCRLFWEKQLLKRYFQGRSVWVGRDKGEARNPERRFRDSKAKIKKDAYNDRVREYHESMGKRTISEMNTTKRAKKGLAMLVKS